MMMKTKINSDGELLEPSLHDAELVRSELDDLKSLRKMKMEMKTENGEQFEVTCMGVEEFQMRNISHQNIVREILLVTKELLRGSISNYRDDFGERYSEIYNEIQNRDDICLLHLLPSVGAEVIVICTQVVITKV